jgi:hypothetical protein
MNYFAETLIGTQIHSVHVDSEVVYIMLTVGTQLTIRGLVIVQPGRSAIPGPTVARGTSPAL